MNRISITSEEGSFLGWFDSDAAETIVKYKEGETYVAGADLLRTANGELVLHDWNSTATDRYLHMSADFDAKEICELLVKVKYGGQDKEMLNLLNSYVI